MSIYVFLTLAKYADGCRVANNAYGCFPQLLKDQLDVVKYQVDGRTRYTIKLIEDKLSFDKVNAPSCCTWLVKFSARVVFDGDKGSCVGVKEAAIPASNVSAAICMFSDMKLCDTSVAACRECSRRPGNPGCRASMSSSELFRPLRATIRA